MAKVTLAGLQQYISDLEVGVALRFDDMEGRLGRIENHLAIIREHLVTRMRESGTSPNGRVCQAGSTDDDADALPAEDV